MGILAAELLEFFLPRIVFGLRSTFPRSQSLANSIGSLSPPIGQQRRVQTFAAKQSADATRYGSSSLSLDQDALFVLRGIGVRRLALATTSESGGETGREPAPALAAAPLRCGSLRSPSLRSAPAKVPEERTPREMPLISSFFFLALLIN